MYESKKVFINPGFLKNPNVRNAGFNVLIMVFALIATVISGYGQVNSLWF